MENKAHYLALTLDASYNKVILSDIKQTRHNGISDVGVFVPKHLAITHIRVVT